jgi:hypothetical protein
MATLLKVLNNLADIKSAGGVALRVRTQGTHKGLKVPTDRYPTADRKRKNVIYSKVLYMDLDVKPNEPDKAYASTEEMEKDFDRFIRESGLPYPTLIVRSGTGATRVLDFRPTY